MAKVDNNLINSRSHITISGAKVHNLKNVTVHIPKNQLVVITGLSGSGKSSLAFDTLYAEGQRRYVESLSSYARQFLGKLDKPDVDSIKGISPTVAIEQKVISTNPRSTVGTNTEIYDYLKLLFARIGKTISPVSGEIVKKDTPSDVLEFIKSDPGAKAMLFAPIIIPPDRSIDKHLKILQEQGFTRIKIGTKVDRIDKIIAKDNNHQGDLHLLIDRFVSDPDNDENNSRIIDSSEIAFVEGEGECTVEIIAGDKTKTKTFSNRYELDGVSFQEPSVNLFSFNNPLGACKKCEGFGQVLGIDPNLVIPDQALSIFEDAVVCWKGPKMGMWKKELLDHANKFGFPIHRPYSDLTDEQKALVWSGNRYFSGLNAFFEYVESKIYQIQYRVMLSRYRGKTICPSCAGSRLCSDALYVKVADRSIGDLSNCTIEECYDFFDELELNEYDSQVAHRILIEISSRLKFLRNVGLGYLSLNRLSNTLSGGESQRINLATSLGSSLVGATYILDEPSIGLHPRDTARLISVLQSLRDIGNSVVVVEHDEEVMESADHIIDMGPQAGALGGTVVFEGNHQKLVTDNTSLTAQYLTGKQKIAIPKSRRKWTNYIQIVGARENNLNNVDVKIPLNVFTVITGVSGSGKSSLVKTILFPALQKHFGGFVDKCGVFNKLEGNLNAIENVDYVDQNPIGKSSRSNPVTYVKAYDDIRNLFTAQQLSKINGFKTKHFSFNVEGGRCDECEGEGQVKIEMQFMADVVMQCDACKGKRFKKDVLEIQYQGKSIYDILCMTVDEAIVFFDPTKGTNERKIYSKLKALSTVGMGYIQLGQSSSTLSGGEAQRIKLGAVLSKEKNEKKTLFIFDEPTTGLHFHDVQKLISAMNALIERGHSVVIIEHHADVIKSADWVIDLGPEGGKKGGNIVFEGIPEDLIQIEESYTGKFLATKFAMSVS